MATKSALAYGNGTCEWTMVCLSTPNCAFTNSFVPPEIQKKMPIRTRAAVTGIHSPPWSIVNMLWIKNDEGKQEHCASRDGQHYKHVDVGEGLRFASHESIKQPLGQLRRVGGAGAGVHQLQAQSFDFVLKRRIERSGVLRQHYPVNLRAPRQ